MTAGLPPVPGPGGHARYLAASYDVVGMTAGHLRDFVGMLDATGVPDDAPAYVSLGRNRTVAIVTLRVDIDDEDPGALLRDLGVS